MKNCVKCCAYTFTLLFASSLASTVIFGILYGFKHLYGCYVGNNVDLCPNWHLKSVSYIRFDDTTALISENCNCGKCVNSPTCNCNVLKCYLIGEYDAGKECKIAYDYYYSDDSDDKMYESLWKYSVLNTTYLIGDSDNYYINSEKFDEYCMSDSDVEDVGKIVYGDFIGLVVSASIFGAISLLILYAWYCDENN